jgi:glycolate oxidase
VRWGSDLRKFAAGYNLRDLWIGSEGMLGIITGAVLKLIPRPATSRTFLAAFRNETDALRGVKRILGAHVVPAILEFLDRQTVVCTLRRLASQAGLSFAESETPRLPKSHPLRFVPCPASVLLIELDGHHSRVREETRALKECLSGRATRIREARDERERENLWELRRNCSQAMFQMGDSKLNEDVVVPLSAQTELLRFVGKLRKSSGLATPTFGHAADGNFHVHIMFDRENADHRRRAETAVQEIMEKVISLGGSISGEHGIGLAKTPFFSLQHSPAEIRAMRAVKDALDPNGILNPGKLFKPFRVWEYEPVGDPLPWDHR